MKKAVAILVLTNPGDYGKSLAKDILEKHSGQAIVVVGHSNTIAPTVDGLTGQGGAR